MSIMFPCWIGVVCSRVLWVGYYQGINSGLYRMFIVRVSLFAVYSVNERMRAATLLIDVQKCDFIQIHAYFYRVNLSP